MMNGISLKLSRGKFELAYDVFGCAILSGDGHFDCDETWIGI